MRHLVLTTIGLAAVLAAFDACGQGYYQRNVQRNPVTGRLEVVPSPGYYGRSVGPDRNQRGFYGTDLNPYSGTTSQSRVRRNPFTGRLDVDNEYYNPWTGARMQTVTRYNPLTRRYETIQLVTPPNKLPAQDQPVEPAEERQTSREKPRVIETAPPPSLDPPIVDADTEAKTDF